MEKFIFNNVNSNTLGLIIKEMPPIVRPAKDIETIKVNGRNGNLHIDNGTYDSYDITINCILSENANIDTIKSTLIGTGKLKLSTVPGRTFIATIKNQINFSKYLKVLREFPLHLEIEPISYGASHSPVIMNETRELPVPGNVETYPIIEIYQAGTITINNIQIQTLHDRIKIDCELMECTLLDGGTNANSYVIMSEFPKLIPGNNYITAPRNVVVSLLYNERWL